MVDWSFLGRRLLGPRLLPPSLYSVDCLYSQHRGFAASVQVPMARHPEGQAAEGIVHPAGATQSAAREQGWDPAVALELHMHQDSQLWEGGTCGPLIP